MKTLLKLLLVLAIAGAAFYFYQSGTFTIHDAPLNGFRDEFDTIDRDHWYIGEWRTNKPAYEKAVLMDGIVNLKIQETDRGPYLLTEVFEVKDPSVITIKRRAQVNFGNDRFMGGLALLQTDRDQFKPQVVEEGADMAFGNGIVLVEYVHNLDPLSRRPGQDAFRVMMPDWQSDGNYKVLAPIFGQWFEEALIYNTKTGQVVYRLNDKEYTLRGFAMSKKFFRVFMHGYGSGVGHSLKMDWFEVEVEPIG